MSDFETGEENSRESLIEEPVHVVDKPEPAPEPAPNDDDDCEGYYLEPAGNNVDIAEKIAEANRKLFEEDQDGGDESRPRKVQFNDELINYEPVYYSDEECTESAQNSIISEEDIEIQTIKEEEEEEEVNEQYVTIETCSDLLENDSTAKIQEPADSQPKQEEEDDDDEDDIEEIVEELAPEVGSTHEEPLQIFQDPNEKNKLLLVLLPKEQNSSVESVIGEEILEEPTLKINGKELKPETEGVVKAKIARPKSAKNSKLKKSCEVAKVSPNLNYSSSVERKSWQCSKNSSVRSKTRAETNERRNIFGGEIKVEITGRFVKKINIDNLNLESSKRGEELKRCCDNRPKSCHDVTKGCGPGENRPKTAPTRKTCYVIKRELPQYNGLRSEYGLSAEQLQERKKRTIEIKHQRKQDRMKEKQEKLRKRNENEEMFRKWLFNKAKKTLNKKPVKTQTDTLTRSDVYIQAHASYASNGRVPYSVNYNISKKSNHKKGSGVGKKSNKTIIVEKLLDKVTPHFKRSFNIYLGVRQ